MQFWNNVKRLFIYWAAVFETLILCRCLTHAYYIEFLEWTKNDLNHKYKTEITISLLFFHTMCPYAIKENYVVILLLISKFNFTCHFPLLEKPFYFGRSCHSLPSIFFKKGSKMLWITFSVLIDNRKYVLTPWIRLRSANAHYCLWLTLGRQWNWR